MEMSFLDLGSTSSRWRRYSEEYLNEARLHFVEVVKSAITVATFIIGFNVIWLQLSKDNEANILTKVLFLSALLCMVVSIIFGIGTLLGANNFLNDVGDDYYDRAEKLNKHILATGSSHAREFPNDISSHPVKGKYLPWHFWAELVFLGLGGLFTLMSAVVLLFF